MSDIELPDIDQADYPSEPATLTEDKPKRGRPRKSTEAREPFVGARVYLWRERHGVLEPMIGFLQNPSRLDKDAWDISCFGVNYVQMAPRHQVKFSETPKIGHWSWMPNGVV